MTNMIKISSLLLALMLLAIPMAAANAQQEISATLSVEAPELTVGDVVPLTLQVTHPAGYRLVPVQLEGTWGDFEIRAVSPPQVTANPDGSETTTQTISVALWAPGEHTTLELPVAVSDTQGELHETSAAPLSVEVASVLVEGDNQLRDIKPQAELPLPVVWPWVVGSLLVSAVILAPFLRRWWLRRQETLAAAPDLRLPHEVAYDELERIEGLNLPVQARFKEHYTLASDVLRKYMEETLHIATVDRTTYEIRHALKYSPLSQTVKSDLQELLMDADLIKFAKVKPEIELAQVYIPRVRRVVAVTTPAQTAVDNDNGHKDEKINPKGTHTPLMETNG
jgi:hypothetical protein